MPRIYDVLVPLGYSSYQVKLPKNKLDVDQISPGQATGFKGTEMTLISCEIGCEGRRNAACRLKGQRYQRVEFGHIPTDILGCQNIRRSTSH